MAANAKILKRRIKSVANTRKITKAMEMVAASKMRRIVSLTVQARPYAELMWDTIKEVLRTYREGIDHPLMADVKSDKTLVITFTSDRGLAGSFNGNILKQTLKTIEEIGNVDVISVGNRGSLVMAAKKIPVIANFRSFANDPKFSEIVPVARMAIDEYEAKKYKSVVIIYTKFISALRQEVIKQEILPLGQDIETEKFKKEEAIYAFEPSPEKVLKQALPRVVETIIYQALLESAASEHSARMIAMRNATDAAGDMLSDLKFTYNQIRQAGITQEIAEISSGAAAVE